jgi:predicted RNA-binding Zn ribbon-like protein
MAAPEPVRGPAFDVHLDALLDVSVRLVNGLTGSWSRGRPHQPPEGPDRVAVVADALAGDARRRPEVSAEEAVQLSDTAELLRQVFDLVTHGDVDGAAAVVNALMVDTGARPELIPLGDGTWDLHFRGKDHSLSVGWAAGCATALAVALGSELGGRVGRCDAVRCDQVFVDQSRNRVRRFCSLACQNRMKSAAFRNRGA